MSYAKILIKAKIEVVTGLHIGTTETYSAIGAIDSPVVRDALKGYPIIPGSSLKGKMRSLLQKTFGASNSHNEDHPHVMRLFGNSSTKDNNEVLPSRLTFKDCFVAEDSIELLKKSNIRITEIKTENTLDRKTSRANPRQIERVIRGVVFDFELIYDVLESHENEVEEDFKNISKAFKLIQNDYLGGHGSRGSGRIKFNDLEIINIYGDAPKVTIEV